MQRGHIDEFIRIIKLLNNFLTKVYTSFERFNDKSVKGRIFLTISSHITFITVTKPITFFFSQKLGQ